jgi:hypothetical protein
MSDKSEFAKVATEIKAELFLQEQAARSYVDPVAVAMLSREPEDPDLLKLAAVYCPEAPAQFYEKELGGKFKM